MLICRETRNILLSASGGEVRNAITPFFDRTCTRFSCATLAFAEFIKELERRSTRLPERLAVGFADAKLLIWAEVKGGDEDLMDALLLADAHTTTLMQDLFYATSTVVVESEDNLEVPLHYQIVYPQDSSEKLNAV